MNLDQAGKMRPRQYFSMRTKKIDLKSILELTLTSPEPDSKALQNRREPETTTVLYRRAVHSESGFYPMSQRKPTQIDRRAPKSECKGRKHGTLFRF